MQLAMEQINILHRQGIMREDVYVLAHTKERTEDLSYAADVNTITMEEEGILNAAACSVLEATNFGLSLSPLDYLVLKLNITSQNWTKARWS